MINLGIILTFIKWYSIIALCFLILNAFLAGYTGNTLDKKDYLDSIIWPVSFSVFVGVCLRFILDNRWKFFKRFGRKK